MSLTNQNRFANLTYDDFRRMAQDDSLSRYEKIGFPDSYREGKEQAIFEDIRTKLPLLDESRRVVLDIGPGCSELPLMLVEQCRERGHQLLLVDSAEMLKHLPDEPFIRKVAGFFPHCAELFALYSGRVDVILVYSVLHYIFAESNVWDFLDRALELLAPGGELLIGDVPNVSKRKRFFSSERGVRFHQEFTGTTEPPEVTFNRIERRSIDDAVLMSLLARARAAGFDAYLVPQRDDLPMANRREDILIRRP
jgi:SAM-dependent methyltransferase